ncbi:unnamed protein product, partial [Ascophyllum nodosum]
MLEKFLKSVPMSRVVAMGVGAGFTTATVLFVASQSTVPRTETMSAEWKAATKDYRRYQN